MHRISRFPSYFLALIMMAAAACGGGGTPSDTGTGPAANVGFSTSAFTFVAIGASQAVTASVNDASGRSVNSAVLTWASDDPTVADVSASGRTATIVAKKAGTTNIHATTGSISNAINIIVLGVNAVALAPTSSSMRVGDTQGVTADVTADNGVSHSVVWTSSNATVASVSASGVITALATGIDTITASAVADRAKTASFQLTVFPSKGVILTPSTASIATGATLQIVPNVVVDPGAVTTLTWLSSTPSVASVSAQGVVTGIAYGSTTITATSVADASLKATVAISVVPVVRTIVITPPSSAPFYLGTTQALTATVTADNGVATTLTWGSSNAAVASVSATGVVTANSTGTTTITATSTADATKLASVAITVASRPVSVAVNPTTLALNPGSSGTLVATVTADPAVSKAVTWTTSAASIATVSNGVVTAVANGSATVTATSVADPTKNFAVSVSVGPRMAATWSATGLGGAMIEDIVSTYAVNGTNAFSVNSLGDIFRFDGTVWTRSAQGSAFATKFTAVHGTNATNVIAVGTGGKIVRWDGAAWTAMTSGTTNDLNDVWMENATSAFAVGSNGVAVRLTGTAWALTTSNSTETLNAVWFAGSNTWLAVGTNGQLLRWVSGVWSVINSPTTVNLRDVFGSSPSDVYAVGEVGTVVHFDGTTWTLVASNGLFNTLYSISGTTAGTPKYFIAGNQSYAQIAGGAVVDLSTTVPYSVQYFSTSVDANGTLWMGGERGISARNAGSVWTTTNIAPDLMDVWTTSLTNAWAVGEFGSIYRFSASGWAKQSSQTVKRLNTVWGSSATDAFAGGDGGLILHYDGTAWTPMTSPAVGDILGMWGSSATNVYAVTFNGEVLRYNGSTWTIVKTQAGTPLYAVFGTSANEVYVTGEFGTVLKSDGTTWTSNNTTTATLLGVWSSASNNVFAVGSLDGVAKAFRFGTAWSSLSVGATVELTSIWGPVPADVYATGGTGTILHFDGTNWQSMASGTTAYLWSISGDPAGMGAGFAVGLNATLVVGASSSSAQGLRMAASAIRTPSNLDPSPEALRNRGNSRPVPQGAARKSLRAMHSPFQRTTGSPAHR